uniref:THAP domain-containing protein 1 n=1 Tax=Cyprinus carpio TaxID=7962 RepID=A0A8C2ARK3_CYPCA
MLCSFWFSSRKCCRVSCLYNSLLSFHTFPSDAEIRRKWLVAIRRDKFTVTPHTRVCSRHFNKEDVREPLSETGRRLLNKGAVPALFEHYSHPGLHRAKVPVPFITSSPK